MRTTVIMFCVLAAALASPWRNPVEEDDPPEDFQKDFNSDTLTRFREWREASAAELEQQLELTEIEKKALEERLETLEGEEFEQVRELGDTIPEINENVDASEDLYQSDIALTEEQMEAVMAGQDLALDSSRSRRNKRTAAQANSRIWDRVIPYSLHSSLTARGVQTIRAGIEFWEQNTCIRFAENGTGDNRLRFWRGRGCYAYLGMQGGTQDVSIGSGCDYVEITTHEIAHALGVLHEMARWDRDDYVTINFDNIQKGFTYAFRRYTQDQIKPFGEPFDISSVMQYPPYGFALKYSTPVIVAKDPNYQYSLNYYQPSHRDLYVVNNYYNCFARCSTKIYCENGGFQNPNNCSSCMCPSGYGGDRCQERAAGCGETITVSDEPTIVNLEQVGNFSDGVIDMSVTKCNYIFKPAPGFTRVKVTVQSIYGVCEATCSFAGVELFTLRDPRAAGYRFCCGPHKPTIISQGPIVRAVVFRRSYAARVALEVTAVNDPPTPSVGNTCMDASEHCEAWNKNGFCDNSGYTRATRELRCAKTCGYCTDCVDAFASCPSWAKDGFCTNEEYPLEDRKKYCAKSCNLC